MSMTPADAEAVGVLISAKVQTFTDSQVLDVDFMWKEIMKIIYANLIADAVVTTTVGVTSVTGVTAGIGVSGPGTGSGAGTLS